jgi:hypothetical protein
VKPLGRRVLDESGGRRGATDPLRALPQNDRQILENCRNGLQLGDHNLQSLLGAITQEQLTRQFCVRGTVWVFVGHVAVLWSGIGLDSGAARRGPMELCDAVTAAGAIEIRPSKARRRPLASLAASWQRAARERVFRKLPS